MSDDKLLLAQQAREDRLLLEEIDRRLDVVLSHADVGFEARSQLRKLLAYYAKKPNPFRACVRDNMKRFGPGRTERICATVKDMIRGGHRWRKGGVAASDYDPGAPEVSDELAELILSLPDDALDRIVMEVAQ